MGYSWENTIEDNTIDMNRFVGIAIEHGFDITIRHNRIRQNGEGIRLWTRGGPVVQHWPGHEVSHSFTIEDNLIETNHTGFHGYTGDDITDRDCHNYHLRGNLIRDNRTGVRFGRVRDCSVEGNQFAGTSRRRSGWTASRACASARTRSTPTPATWRGISPASPHADGLYRAAGSISSAAPSLRGRKTVIWPAARRSIGCVAPLNRSRTVYTPASKSAGSRS